MNQIYPLQGAVQYYAWGGTSFIPQLIRQANPDQKNFAELWMGTHFKGPASLTIDQQQVLLSDFLKQHPEALSAKTRQQFGIQLPFLFKILDVKDMLSIQTHPTKKQAEIGFRKENDAGIPTDAPHRNYRDDNHKPELMVALTEFWLLHGFRSAKAIKEVLLSVPEFAPLLKSMPVKIESFSKQDIPTLYQYIMKLPQPAVDDLLKPLHLRLANAFAAKAVQKSQSDFWAFRAMEQYTSEAGHYDRGIFSIYLFNLLCLQPGEGIFQDAGIPHAYLEGVNVELMANSDNVFRGGLTVKHVDVPELMANLIFEPVTPNILKGRTISGSEDIFDTPAPDFALSKIEIAPMLQHQETAESAQIWIVVEGSVTCNALDFRKGESFFAPAGTSIDLTSPEKATLFKAFVP